MQFCPYCGQPQADQAHHCTYCGGRLVAAGDQETHPVPGCEPVGAEPDGSAVLNKSATEATEDRHISVVKIIVAITILIIIVVGSVLSKDLFTNDPVVGQWRYLSEAATLKLNVDSNYHVDLQLEGGAGYHLELSTQLLDGREPNTYSFDAQEYQVTLSLTKEQFLDQLGLSQQLSTDVRPLDGLKRLFEDDRVVQELRDLYTPLPDLLSAMLDRVVDQGDEWTVTMDREEMYQLGRALNKLSNKEVDTGELERILVDTVTLKIIDQDQLVIQPLSERFEPLPLARVEDHS